MKKESRGEGATGRHSKKQTVSLAIRGMKLLPGGTGWARRQARARQGVTAGGDHRIGHRIGRQLASNRMLASATVLPPRRWASARAAEQAAVTACWLRAVCGKLATPMDTVKLSS